MNSTKRRALLAAAVAAPILAVRLFTGIYYRSDEAVAYLVLKPAPDLAIVRGHVDEDRFRRAIVLADDENDLAFGPIYRGAMRVAPVVIVALLGYAGIVAMKRGRRPRGR